MDSQIKFHISSHFHRITDESFDSQCRNYVAFNSQASPRTEQWHFTVAHMRVDGKFTCSVSNFRGKMRPFRGSLEPRAVTPLKMLLQLMARGAQTD